MKRTLVVFSLVVCLLTAVQTSSFAETVTVISRDDPTFNGGAVTVPLTDDWATNPGFMSGTDWQPDALTEEESASAMAKSESSESLLAAEQAANSALYQALTDPSLAETFTVQKVGLIGGTTVLTPPSFGSILPAWWRYAYFKIPNYNQGQTPYCGPFSALQILRYKGYSETNLLPHLIAEMYVPGQGSNIYRLASSLRKRLKYSYIASFVYGVDNYFFKHMLTVGRDRMPIDNLVRIYGGRLGKYRKYHSGHYIDSSGYYLSGRSSLLFITDTYQEYAYGKASGTLGPQWVSFLQMYLGVKLHPQQKVVW